MARKTATKPTKSGINTNFWAKLPKPFFVLAPMANVTDSVFRVLIAKYGKPDVIWTEFVSADGLISSGQKNLLHDLKFSKKERPIVAQLFTGHPEVMKKAARIIADLGFDGLDINMGCPDKKVEKQGGGAALMNNPTLAVEVLRAAREGVKTPIKKSKIKSQKLRSKDKSLIANNDSDYSVPVSIKTRLGYNKIDLDWIRFLLAQHLPALTVHLRTRKEMSDVPAHWEVMPEIIRLKNEISPETVIIGNGDVMSLEEAKVMTDKYGCEGIMIGRGIFGKPWFFVHANNVRKGGKVGKRTKEYLPKERLKILLEHAKLYEKTFNGIKSFDIMKKHFKAYVSGWDGAKELRIKLFEAENVNDVKKIIANYNSFLLLFPIIGVAL